MVQRFKKMLLWSLLLVCVSGSIAWAEEPAASGKKAYETETGILYREEASESLTEYMKEQCRLDWYYPTDRKGFTTVVWFHGGGLTAGKREVPKPLKEQGIAVAGVGYRLHPKAKCPEYLEDAAAAVAWVFKHVERYGGDPKRIFVAGHSAGGYLTAMVGLDRRWLARYEVDANDIAGLIPFSGHAITHFTIRKERGILAKQPIVDEYAPLYHVRSDAPPMLLILGDRELEMMGRYEENAYLARMMKVAGHKKTTLYELQGFDHGTMAAPAFGLLLKQLKQQKQKPQ